MKKHTLFFASWLTVAGALFLNACHDKEKIYAQNDVVLKNLDTSVRPVIEIRVVLERYADQVANRILRQLGQLFGAEFGMRRSGNTESAHHTGKKPHPPD